MKFTLKGGEITVGSNYSFKKPDRIQFYVKDTGVGMEKKN